MLMTHATGSVRIRPGFDVTLLPQRNYDTTLGRFTSFDTFDGHITDPITLNHYTYGNSDPVNTIDPSGHESLGELGVTISIGVGVPIGLGAASSAVYAKVLGGNAGKGFVAGLQLGVAFDIAYFSGGGGVSGLKKFGDVVLNSFWTGVIKLTSKNLEYKLKGADYPSTKQAQDFYEAFTSAAFYNSFGDLIGGSNIGDDPVQSALTISLASLGTNFLTQLPGALAGETSWLDAISTALQNTEVAFLQGNLINEVIKDFPTALGRTAVKTALAASYQAGTDAFLKIIAAAT